MLYQLGNHALEDVHVALYKGQTRLSLPLTSTSSNNAHTRASCHSIIGVCINLHVPVVIGRVF